MPGHSNERCLKLNGYPPGSKGFKDKRVASTILTQPGADDSSYSKNNITLAQYNQLMGMLNGNAHKPSIILVLNSTKVNLLPTPC